MEIANSHSIISQTQILLDRASSSFHRECIVLAGDQDWCINAVERLGQEADLSHSIVVSSEPVSISLSTSVAMDKSLQYLGHEFNHAIINCHEGIDPNVFGAISGTVRGGGLLILLIPTIDKLQDFDDPETRRMTIWPYQTKDVHHRFLARFENTLIHSKKISLFTSQSARISDTSTDSDLSKLDTYLKNDRCATDEQRQTVEAIVHVVDGHRRRPLVITADRGRGKSSALGIAAADLLKRGGQQIIATGPRYSATEKIFEHAAAQVMGAVKNNEIIYKDSFLRYMSVDAIIEENPDCSLLLVDEAATIPVNLLTKLLTHYSRVVFSTTTYGYEGTGRGFNLRFFDKLNKTVPGWKHAQIKSPIRWAEQDPLEDFMSELLCLNADIARISTDIDYSQVDISIIDRNELITDTQLLDSIFGLLILAHYKTQPRDLRYLMDSLDLSIFIARHKDTILGAAIVETEGALEPPLSEKVYKNERRVQGHLLPQSMEATIGIKNSSQLRYLRVIRIITHPSCQRQGIGKKLIASVEQFANQNNVDLIGANFGINNELLPFWDATGYCPVHVGLAANTSTGTHSVSVLKAKTTTGEELLKNAKILFTDRFAFLLTTSYKDLDVGLVDYLCSVYTTSDNHSLNDQHIEYIKRFAHSNSEYDMAALYLNQFAHICMRNERARQSLDDSEKALIIKKVLQQHSWSSVISTLKLEGKNQAIQKLRDVVNKLIKQVL